jgi:hypothetical protein
MSKATQFYALNRAHDDIMEEYVRARKTFGSFASPHEAYAVLLEEMDELWEEVKANKGEPRLRRMKMRREAMQIGAMALAFMHECCLPPREMDIP